ncbi:MAG: nitroreductase family deazaflavin-dependent oxidoreductase [Chloroflexi bacterium]|nr:nitroreductase family deazaflavin-dependent oxidoreductase [Chloroflexota bacterium]
MWYNALMAWLLRSPMHGMLSQSLMLVTVTGRKSGKAISTPVNYVRDGNTLWVTSQRDRTWWRNLTGGAPIRVQLAGKEQSAHGEAIVDEPAVTENLAAFFGIAPQYAKYFKVALDTNGKPSAEDCTRAAKERVMVRIELEAK